MSPRDGATKESLIITMSIRIISTLAAVASLVTLVGCATGEDIENEEGSGSTSESAEMPTIETDVDTQANGFSCGCPSGTELSGGLCYPKCKSGYSGDGPVCWQTCAAGFTDTGWFCQRNSHVTSANTSKCPWYNKCGLGSSCSVCPAGYSNDGCTCRRDAYIYAQPSYGRGAGKAIECTGN